jgi:hypothetical protein
MNHESKLDLAARSDLNFDCIEEDGGSKKSGGSGAERRSRHTDWGCHCLFVNKIISVFGLSVRFREFAGFGFGDGFSPESVFAVDSGFRFEFRF